MTAQQLRPIKEFKGAGIYTFLIPNSPDCISIPHTNSESSKESFERSIKLQDGPNTPWTCICFLPLSAFEFMYETENKSWH